MEERTAVLCSYIRLQDRFAGLYSGMLCVCSTIVSFGDLESELLGKRNPLNAYSPNAVGGAYDAALARFLSLQEAAAFLGIHPNTLRSYAKAGFVPGAKFDRDWRFLETDLVASLRARYCGHVRMQSSADEKETIWYSGNVQAHTLSSSQRLTERQLDALLEPPTGKGLQDR